MFVFKNANKKIILTTQYKLTHSLLKKVIFEIKIFCFLQQFGKSGVLG